RHLPLIFVACRKKCGMRTTKAERDSEALSRSDANVGSKLSRRHEQSQTEEIRRNHGQRLVFMESLNKGAVVNNLSVCRGILNQGPKERDGEIPGIVIADNDIDPQRLRTRFHDGDRLWMTGPGNKERTNRRLLSEGKTHCH